MAPYDFPGARKHVESVLNYRFITPDLLEEALYAGGPVIIGGRLITEANKRLAMVGDCALDLALAIAGYNTGLARGPMDIRRSSTASDGNLSNVGITHSIDGCIKLDPGALSVSLKTRATAIEAIIGAVYLDSGDFEAVRRCVTVLGL